MVRRAAYLDDRDIGKLPPMRRSAKSQAVADWKMERAASVRIIALRRSNIAHLRRSSHASSMPARLFIKNAHEMFVSARIPNIGRDALNRIPELNKCCCAFDSTYASSAIQKSIHCSFADLTEDNSISVHHRKSEHHALSIVTDWCSPSQRHLKLSFCLRGQLGFAGEIVVYRVAD